MPGRSILMMSAPRSPRIWVATGPASTRLKSRTRNPSSAKAMKPLLQVGMKQPRADRNDPDDESRPGGNHQLAKIRPCLVFERNPQGITNAVHHTGEC